MPKATHLVLCAIVPLCASCYTVPSAGVPVWTKDIAQTRYVRVNLRGENVYLKSANDLNEPISVRLGSPASIEHYTARRVDLVVNHLKVSMYPQDGLFDTSTTGVEQFIEKYLTADSASVRALTPANDAIGMRIVAGDVAVGMTKEQIYAALGPPRWLETEIPTVHLPLQRILESDRWVYTRKVFAELIPQQQVFEFNAGKLIKATPGS